MITHPSAIFLGLGIFGLGAGILTQSDAIQVVAIGAILGGGIMAGWNAWRKAQVALALEEARGEVERRAVYTAEIREERDKLRVKLDAANRRLANWEASHREPGPDEDP